MPNIEMDVLNSEWPLLAAFCPRLWAGVKGALRNGSFFSDNIFNSTSIV